jgi:hypothetical protein
MSLAALIEAKSRRTEALPILVGDASAAAAEVAVHRGALEAQQATTRQLRESGAEVPSGLVEREEQLRANLSDALARMAATVVQVPLQSLPPDQWDAVLDPLEPNEDGEIDLDEVRAELVAASVVVDDEDAAMRTPAWWEEQFARQEWTKGEKLAVNNLLIRLNLHTPSAGSGKG